LSPGILQEGTAQAWEFKNSLTWKMEQAKSSFEGILVITGCDANSMMFEKNSVLNWTQCWTRYGVEPGNSDPIDIQSDEIQKAL
jgi:hypothetical protein